MFSNRAKPIHTNSNIVHIEGECPYVQKYETLRHGSINYAMACYQLWLYDRKICETGMVM
jgi:hypothetical protein